MLASEPSSFVLPALSVNLPLATLIDAVPVKFNEGVKVAAYADPLPVKLDSVPPVTTTSASTKSLTLSLTVKIIVEVLPILILVKLLEIAIVGGVRSIL